MTSPIYSIGIAHLSKHQTNVDGFGTKKDYLRSWYLRTPSWFAAQTKCICFIFAFISKTKKLKKIVELNYVMRRYFSYLLCTKSVFHCPVMVITSVPDEAIACTTTFSTRCALCAGRYPLSIKSRAALQWCRQI